PRRPPGVPRSAGDARAGRPADPRVPQGVGLPALLTLPGPPGPASPVRGLRAFDITDRPLVMGILNRTPDSFYDKGATFALDDLVRRAELLVDQGADLLDVGGVKAGPGEFVDEAEELDRVIPAIEALATRFDIALSVDTWRASVARQAYRAGAVVGNDISGFAD